MRPSAADRLPWPAHGRLRARRSSALAGACGPVHTFDSEQLWTVLEGTIRARVGGEESDLVAGDTLVLPAGAMRQIVALTTTRLLVCGRGDAIVRVDGEDGPRGTPEWIA